MKFLKYLIASFLICSTASFAEQFRVPSKVTLPFENQPVISDKNNGLSFDFDTRDFPSRSCFESASP